jgi:hypothetical protein
LVVVLIQVVCTLVPSSLYWCSDEAGNGLFFTRRHDVSDWIN